MSVRSTKKLNVGIIGAGPSGSMLAWQLCKAGHKVTILERRSSVDRKVCGEYLCPKGVELLDTLGLKESICAGFLPIHGMVLASPENDILKTWFPRPHGKEEGLAINRLSFDQRLLELAEQVGSLILFNQTVLGVEDKKDYWKVETAEGRKFTFDLLVAADGRSSKIGSLLGHHKNIHTKRIAVHCYLPRKIERGLRLGEMHIFKDYTYCGLDPVKDDEVNFSVVCAALKIQKKSPQDLINELISSSPRLQQMFDPVTEDTEIKIVSNLKNTNSFIAGNKLAYIGDAAGFIDPLTGEGIYNALLTSKLLADNLSRHNDLEKALLSYKIQKKKITRQKYILNNFFQFLIQRPLLIKLTVRFLQKSQERADEFIGIIGNINDPITGIKKMLKA